MDISKVLLQPKCMKSIKISVLLLMFLVHDLQWLAFEGFRLDISSKICFFVYQKIKISHLSFCEDAIVISVFHIRFCIRVTDIIRNIITVSIFQDFKTRQNIGKESVQNKDCLIAV